MRKLFLIAFLACSAADGLAQAPGFDIYGGSLLQSCPNSTGHFIVEKVGNRWWFCTPNASGQTVGHVFFSNSVGNLVTNSNPTNDCAGKNTYPIYAAKYGLCGNAGQTACVQGGPDTGITYNWGWQTEKRMQAWGFNSIGQDSGAYVLPYTTCQYNPLRGDKGYCNWPPAVIGQTNNNPIQMPYIFEDKPAEYASVNQTINGVYYLSEPVKDLINGTDTNFGGYRGGALFDGFDPKLATWWTNELTNNPGAGITNLKSNNPWLLGLFTDDSDFFTGIGPGPDFVSSATSANIAETVLITAPVQRFNPNTNFQNLAFIYNTGTNYSKTQANNTVGCSLSNPCSLRDYLHDKYGTIAALNTAWSSPGCSPNCPNYDTFDSDGTTVSSETVGTGDGTTTLFTHTLAHTSASPFSVLVSVGTGVAGDCPYFRPYFCSSGGSAGSLQSWKNPSPTTVTGSTAGGTLAATKYWVRIAYVTNGAAGPWSLLYCQNVVSNNLLLTLTSPPAIYGVTGWNVYAVSSATACGSADPGGESLQNASPIAIGTGWTEPVTGLTTGGASPPQNIVVAPAAISSAAWAANVATITLTGSLPAGYTTGAPVLVGAVGNNTNNYTSVYNGTFTITGTSGGNSFTYALTTNPGANYATGSTALSFVNYTTGALSVQFGSPPASGQAVTVSYVYGGWKAGGKGLMDEDGSGPWIGTNAYCVEGANPSYPTYFACQTGLVGNYKGAPNACNDGNPADCAIGADLDGWIPQFVGGYVSTMQTRLRASGSNIPYFGIDVLGGAGAPSPTQVLQGESPYVDGGFVTMRYNAQPSAPAAFQSMYQYITQYFGDKPLINFQVPFATPESAYWCKGLPGDSGFGNVDYLTQAQRGQNYYNLINYLLTTPSYNNTYQFVGFDWWEWFDAQNFNQGLVSIRDNAYDGIEDTVPLGFNQFGLQNGGEDFNFGNCLTGPSSVSAANGVWLNLLGGQSRTEGGATTMSGTVR